MDRYKAAQLVCVLAVLAMVAMLGCCTTKLAAAQSSGVTVVASSDGGYFSFTGSGAYWDFDLDVFGFDEANVDLTNHWDLASSRVVYDNIDAGNIFVKVTEHFPGDEMYYFDWHKLDIEGDGVYAPGGGRCVEVRNSTNNVTGWVEYRTVSHKAQFLYDTRHTSADLKVIVHNGHLLENATVIVTNGNREVKWTDENGEAEFSPTTGLHHIIIEHPEFSPMLVDDLFFESDKSYVIRINMTRCISSTGNTTCGASAEDLILYYKDKDPAMGPISPQGYVNYYADQLKTCAAGDNKQADGTLEVMARKWGILPDPPLNVLLYSCNFTKLECGAPDDCLWNVTFTVKNYQGYPCRYAVNMIAGNTTTPLEIGDIGSTWSETSRKTVSNVVSVNGRRDNRDMFLTVVSERLTD